MRPNGSHLAPSRLSRCPDAERDEGVGAVWHVRIRATPESRLREHGDGPTGGQGHGPAHGTVRRGCRVDRTGSGRPGNYGPASTLAAAPIGAAAIAAPAARAVSADVKAGLVMVMFVSPVFSCLVLRLRCVDKSAGYAIGSSMGSGRRRRVRDTLQWFVDYIQPRRRHFLLDIG